VLSQRRVKIPYTEDASIYFSRIKDMPCPVWLDSGRPAITKGRYDILSAAPSDLFKYELDTAEGLAQRLRSLLNKSKEQTAGLPFAGGLIGYMSYELGRAWQGLPKRSLPRLAPDFYAGLYGWAIVIDHHQRSATLVSETSYVDASKWQHLSELLSEPFDKNASLERNHYQARLLSDSLDEKSYAKGFEKIQQYIVEGDVYQVNFTRRFQAETTADSFSLYQRLREISPAPYGAYLEFPELQILSNSPEQFVSLQQGKVATRPIKGTRPRGHDVQEDIRLRADLAASDKDRAENLMIVDLLRNDLGRVCVPGSIDVPELFSVETFATVHHLVSTVTGELAADKDAIDLLQACFPGGSITGAPKHRAMEVIDELESQAREVYCGSIFRLGFDGNLDSNICIRTLLKKDHKLHYSAGGGIVADSECAEEYQESLDKAAAFFKLLEG